MAIIAHSATTEPTTTHHNTPLLHGHRLGQVAREIHVDAVQHRQMVRDHLKWNNAQDTRQTVDRLRNADRLELSGDRFIALVADDNRLTLASRHLLQSTVDFLSK